MDKREVTGGIFAGLLTGGSWMRLAMWAKRSDTREIVVSLHYFEGASHWTLGLIENGQDVFRGKGPSLQAVTIEAVAALGKSL